MSGIDDPDHGDPAADEESRWPAYLWAAAVLAGVFVSTAVVLYLLQRAPSFREIPAFGQALWALAMAGTVALLLGGAPLDR